METAWWGVIDKDFVASLSVACRSVKLPLFSCAAEKPFPQAVLLSLYLVISPQKAHERSLQEDMHGEREREYR